MEQPNTPADQVPEQRNASSAVVTRPAGAAKHSGGFITRGSGVGLARQWRTFNLIANVVAIAAVPAV